MSAPLLATLGVTIAAICFWHWVNHVVSTSPMTGDTWFIRQMAFTNQPVSAPYCWRPLVPVLARHVGFFPLSYMATLATPVLIYFWLGEGWTGFLCAMLFVGNYRALRFNVRNPEYTESVGQLLMFASVWAISVSSPLAWPLLLLAALCRETITAALGAIVLFWNPWLLVPLVAGSAVSWFTRRENKDNRHPLVEKTPYETVTRWVKQKGGGTTSYAHVLQPLRGLAFAVPFMWGEVGSFSRLGLVGFIPIWLLAVPASGQSRIMCYGLALLYPFAAALPLEWLGVFVLLAWFWPHDIQNFDESGGDSFAFVS